MDRELPIRVTVIEPPPGVSFAMQRGKDELLPPSKVGTQSLVFDLSIRVLERRQAERRMCLAHTHKESPITAFSISTPEQRLVNQMPAGREEQKSRPLGSLGNL